MMALKNVQQCLASSAQKPASPNHITCNVQPSAHLPRPGKDPSLALVVHSNGLGLPRLLAAPLLAAPDVSPASTTAAKTHLDQPRDNGSSASDPHEDKHLGTNVSTNVDLRDRGDGVAEDDEQNRGKNGSDRGQKGGDKGEEAHEESGPAGVD